MIERISDKSSYATIDPVFAQPPSYDNGSEPFDAALFRAVRPATDAASTRESDDRARQREAEGHDHNRIGRSEPLPKKDRPRDHDEQPDGVARANSAHSPDDSNRSTDKVEKTANGEAHAADTESNRTDGKLIESETSHDANAAAADVAAADDAAKIAVGVVEVAIAAATDDAAAATADAAADVAIGSVEVASADATDAAAAKPSTAVVGDGHDSRDSDQQADNAAQLTSAADAALDAADAAAASEKAGETAADGKTETASRDDSESNADAAKIAKSSATNPQAMAHLVANGAAPVADAGGTLKANTGRESRAPQRTIANSGERTTAASGATAAAAQAVSAVVAQTNASSPAENAANTSTGTPQSAVNGTESRGAAPPTPREGNAPHDAAGPRALAGRLAQGRPGGPGRTEGSNIEAEVQRVRLIQRVARAFQTLGDGGGELRIRLSPPSLGSIKLEVTLQAGVMSARIETETAAAKALLMDNLPALRERLSTHDIKVSQFDIETSADSRQQNQFAGQDRGEDRSPRGPIGQPQRHTHEPPPPVVARPQAPKGGLDVLI